MYEGGGFCDCWDGSGCCGCVKVLGGAGCCGCVKVLGGVPLLCKRAPKGVPTEALFGLGGGNF